MKTKLPAVSKNTSTNPTDRRQVDGLQHVTVAEGGTRARVAPERIIEVFDEAIRVAIPAEEIPAGGCGEV